jgi:Cyclophilin type peptidyl-prolyl cis-trans isomerase/CLD
MFNRTDMATSRNKINAVLYTGFNALTSRARHLQDDRRSLNRRYTVFGEVFRGMEVVDKIGLPARRVRQSPEADFDENDGERIAEWNERAWKEEYGNVLVRRAQSRINQATLEKEAGTRMRPEDTVADGRWNRLLAPPVAHFTYTFVQQT